MWGNLRQIFGKVEKPPAPEERLVALDCETTGLYPRAGDKIVSISAIEIIGRKEIGKKLDFLVNPDRPIPAEASKIHGLYQADLERAPLFAGIASDLSAFVGESRIVGFNLWFDLGFLANEFAVAGITLPPALTSGFDAMRLYERHRGRRKLYEACQEAGIDLAGFAAHRAPDDAKATALLFIHLCGIGLDPETAYYSSGDEVPEQRSFDDQNLEAAWQFYEKYRFDEALPYALKAFSEGIANRQNAWHVRAVELTAMIYRKQNRLLEEEQLLKTFICNVLGPKFDPADLSYEKIDRFLASTKNVAREGDEAPIDLYAHMLPVVIGRRPAPTFAQIIDRYNRVRERLETSADDIDTRIRKTAARLPVWAAYAEHATSLRLKIGMEKKAGRDIKLLLMEMHKLAQQFEFVWGKGSLPGGKTWIPPGIILEYAAGPDMEKVVGSWEDVGYQHLTLLKKTDLGHLIKAFGEPKRHAHPRDEHIKLWHEWTRRAKERWISLQIE